MAKALNQPTIFKKEKITKTMLLKIRNKEEIQIKHPYIQDLTLKIYHSSRIEEVLNIPTVFYGTAIVLSDTSDGVFPEHNVRLSEEEMVAYIQDLLSQQTVASYRYCRTLKEKAIHLGDLIEFQDGKRAVIVSPPDNHTLTNLHYIPLKKDGTQSNYRPRILYGNQRYQLLSKNN